MFFSTLTFSATVWNCSNATLLVTVQLLALLHFSCFCLLVSSCRDFKLRSVQFFSFTLGQHFRSVVYTNDSISWTGGIHRVETSDLRQACPVKRVCWILLGTPVLANVLAWSRVSGLLWDKLSKTWCVAKRCVETEQRWHECIKRQDRQTRRVRCKCCNLSKRFFGHAWWLNQYLQMKMVKTIPTWTVYPFPCLSLLLHLYSFLNPFFSFSVTRTVHSGSDDLLCCFPHSVLSRFCFCSAAWSSLSRCWLDH